MSPFRWRLQGGDAAFATALPDNVLTDSFEQELRRLRVDASLVRRSKSGRFGIYFVETGANQRAGTVTYDRDQSSISLTSAGDYDWDAIFAGAHVVSYHRDYAGFVVAIGRRRAACAQAGPRAKGPRVVRSQFQKETVALETGDIAGRPGPRNDAHAWFPLSISSSPTKRTPRCAWGFMPRKATSRRAS